MIILTWTDQFSNRSVDLLNEDYKVENGACENHFTNLLIIGKCIQWLMYLSTFGGESGLLAAFFAFACDIKKNVHRHFEFECCS